MKNIFQKILIFLMILALGACSLEEDPQGLMAPEGFFKTKSDAEAAIYGAYAEWATTQIEKSYSLALMLRSDMVDIGDRNTLGYRVAINDFGMDANNSLLKDTWVRMYNCISAANTAIKASTEIEAEESVKNELEASARFVKAFTYFHLVRTFGDVPYLEGPVESAEAMDAVGRTPMSEIYNYIIDDLKFAKEYLPNQNASDVRNLGTKGSAATVLADVYLTLERYEDAATEAKYVISNASSFNYSLAQNYQDIFNAEVVASLAEPILTIDLKNTLNDGAYNQKDGMINLTRIRDLAPRSLSVAVPSLKAYQSWDDRDYRKQVCFDDTVVYKGEVKALTDTQVRVPRPHIAKYYRYPGPQEAGDDRSSDHHYCLYRYAEVLLMAAEAIAESDGATAEAIGYVNQVRERARFNGSSYNDFPADIATGISNNDFIQAIREERRLELAFEFKRWYDIKRWAILEEVFETSSSLEAHDVDSSRDYLFPIPQTEIDVTGFAQNSGY